MAKREEEYKRLEIFYQMLVYYLDRPYSDNDLAALLGTSRGNVWRIRKIIKTLEIPSNLYALYHCCSRGNPAPARSIQRRDNSDGRHRSLPERAEIHRTRTRRCRRQNVQYLTVQNTNWSFVVR